MASCLLDVRRGSPGRCGACSKLVCPFEAAEMIDTLSPALGLSSPLRHPVPTGTRRGPQTQRGYSQSSPQQGVNENFPMFLELRRERKKRLRHSARLPETRTKCESASCPDLVFRIRSRRSREMQNGSFAAPILQVADYQLFLVLAGCRRRCVTAISQQRTASTTARQIS